jgi:predicted nucleotidyltransferase
MAKSKNITVINFFGKQLKARGLIISKIILFGSQARGGATAESDIDIAIVSVDFRGKDIFKRVELIKEAERATIREFMVPLDIVALTPEELESGCSLIAGYARAGRVFHAA